MHFREQCFAAAMEICSESELAEVVHAWLPGDAGYVVATAEGYLPAVESQVEAGPQPV